MAMRAKDFVELIREKLSTDEKQFEFKNPSDESMFLYGFRAQHPGEFDGDVWTMMRTWKKKSIQIKVNNVSTTIDRRSLIEMGNVLTIEINDLLRCKFGEEAKLHEFVG